MAPRSRVLAALGLLLPLLLLPADAAAAPPTKGAETLQRRVLSPPLANGGGFCGDGTPAIYYYAPPPAGSDLAKTWIIYLEGGAMCFTAEGCAKRLTDPVLGKAFPLTAKGSPAELASAKAGTGDLLSNDPAHSPFALAHRVHVSYCTQDAHLGQVVRPSNATFGVHFDGHLNLQGIVDDLASDGIEGAERVLLFGMSAGGIGVFGNVDWLQQRLPNAAVKGAPAAGFVAPTDPGTSSRSGPFLEPVGGYASFLVGGDAGSAPDIWDFWEGAAADIWNATAAGLPSVARAAAALGDDWDFSMNQLYPFVEAPLFILQAMYDMLQTCDMGVAPCDDFRSSQDALDNSTFAAWLAYNGNATSDALSGTSYLAAAENTPAAVDAVTRAWRNQTFRELMEEKLDRDGVFVANCWAHGVGGGQQFCPSTGPPPTTMGSDVDLCTSLTSWFFDRHAAMPHRFIDANRTIGANPICEPAFATTLIATEHSKISPTYELKEETAAFVAAMSHDGHDA